MANQDSSKGSSHVAGDAAPLPIRDGGPRDNDAAIQFLSKQLGALGRATKKPDVFGVLVAALMLMAVPNHGGIMQHRVAPSKTTHIPIRSRDIHVSPCYVAPEMGRAGPTKIGREFGRRLRACRIAAGFENAADFADSLGLESPTYRRYERGEAEPPFEILIAMSRLTGKTIDFLLTGRKDQNEELHAED